MCVLWRCLWTVSVCVRLGMAHRLSFILCTPAVAQLADFGLARGLESTDVDSAAATRPVTSPLMRKRTKHVVTRWYRYARPPVSGLYRR